MDSSQMSRRALRPRSPTSTIPNGSSCHNPHAQNHGHANGGNSGHNNDLGGSTSNSNRSILLVNPSKTKQRQLSLSSKPQQHPHQRILNVQTSLLFLCAIATLVCLAIQGRIFQTTTATDVADMDLDHNLRHMRITNVLDASQQYVVDKKDPPSEVQIQPLTTLKTTTPPIMPDTTQHAAPRIVHFYYWDDQPMTRKKMPYDVELERDIFSTQYPAPASVSVANDNKYPISGNMTRNTDVVLVLEDVNSTDVDSTNANNASKNDDLVVDLDGDEDADGDDQDEDKQGMNHDDNEDNFGFVDPNDPCVPMAPWQSALFVTCNIIHEVDLVTSVVDATIPQAQQSNEQPQQHALLDAYDHHHHHSTWNETQLQFLGQGWFRMAWRLDHHAAVNTEDGNMDNEDKTESLILKMLRSEREFTREFYELHRRDALAMERLTHSRFVLNVYGYCGQSALNELANFRIPQLSTLEKFDRMMRGHPKSPRLNRMKLKLAASVAAGLAHVHEIPVHDPALPPDLLLEHQHPQDNGSYPSPTDGRATMVHYDINPRNVAIVAGALPRLNDFNVARFLRWNPSTNKTCGFESTLHEPWWRAPEEVHINATPPMLLDEKVDLYALGNVLFHILTTHAPRGKMKRERMEEVRPNVLKGVPPGLPSEYVNSNDPCIMAFLEALALCFVAEPSQRGTARQVSNILFDALLELVGQEEPRLQSPQADQKGGHRKRKKGKPKRNRK